MVQPKHPRAVPEFLVCSLQGRERCQGDFICEALRYLGGHIEVYEPWVGWGAVKLLDVARVCSLLMFALESGVQRKDEGSCGGLWMARSWL